MIWAGIKKSVNSIMKLLSVFPSIWVRFDLSNIIPKLSNNSVKFKKDVKFYVNFSMSDPSKNSNSGKSLKNEK